MTACLIQKVEFKEIVFFLKLLQKILPIEQSMQVLSKYEEERELIFSFLFA